MAAVHAYLGGRFASSGAAVDGVLDCGLIRDRADVEMGWWTWSCADVRLAELGVGCGFTPM